MSCERSCPLFGSCYYPGTRGRFFVPEAIPCSHGARCEVEVLVQVDDLFFTIDRADQVERNIGKGLPWNCGCPLCQRGDWRRCYQKDGPDKGLRALFASEYYVAPWQTTQSEAATASTDEARAP